MKASVASVLLLVFLSVALSACATKVWYQPGKTQADLHRDWATSQLAGQRAAAQVHSPLVFDPDVALGLAIRARRDAGNTAEQVSRLTMQTKGYQLVPISAVPTNEPYLKP